MIRKVCFFGLKKMCFMQIESVLQTKNWSESAKNRFSVALFQTSCLFFQTSLVAVYYTSHVMRKSVLAICEQQRCRSACASTHSLISTFVVRNLDGTSGFYIQNFKTLACLCSWAGRLESYLVANPEDKFSRDEAHTLISHHPFAGNTRRYLQNKAITDDLLRPFYNDLKEWVSHLIDLNSHHKVYSSLQFFSNGFNNTHLISITSCCQGNMWWEICQPTYI